MEDRITLIYRRTGWMAAVSVVASAVVLLAAASPGWAVQRDRELIRAALEGPPAEIVEAPVTDLSFQLASTSP